VSDKGRSQPWSTDDDSRDRQRPKAVIDKCWQPWSPKAESRDRQMPTVVIAKGRQLPIFFANNKVTHQFTIIIQAFILSMAVISSTFPIQCFLDRRNILNTAEVMALWSLESNSKLTAETAGKCDAKLHVHCASLLWCVMARCTCNVWATIVTTGHVTVIWPIFAPFFVVFYNFLSRFLLLTNVTCPIIGPLKFLICWYQIYHLKQPNFGALVLRKKWEVGPIHNWKFKDDLKNYWSDSAQITPQDVFWYCRKVF